MRHHHGPQLRVRRQHPMEADEVLPGPGHQRLFEVSEHFRKGFERHIATSGAAVRFQQLGPCFGLYFGIDTVVTNYRQAAKRDLAAATGMISRIISLNLSRARQSAKEISA